MEQVRERRERATPLVPVSRPSKDAPVETGGSTMRKRPGKFEPKDDSAFDDLTDSDRVALKRLMAVRDKRGHQALQREWKALVENDLERASHIAFACFPIELVNTVRKQMAEAGMTLDDLEESALKELLKETPDYRNTRT
jgi:hypothetical protein